MSPAIKRSTEERPADTFAAYSDTSKNRNGNDILVSAIVSVYKAGKFIDGCLNDLTRQTIIDRMEIIVVDSASDEGESRIVRSYQDRWKNIIYLRTGERETVYAAWNRGIKLASGKYITNANTDDRHRKDAFEVMASALENHTEVALVYADLLITETENQTIENCTPTGRFAWLEWDRRKLLEGQCFMGPQPMWRRSLHEEYGYFRSDFITSGDYEYWLRVSQTHDFMHLPVVLGLYLKTPTSIEHSNREAQTRENLAILSEYKAAEERGIVINRARTQDAEALMGDAVAGLDKGDAKKAFDLARIGLLLEDPSPKTLTRMANIIEAGTDAGKVDALFRSAIELFPHNKDLLYQYISILLTQGRSGEALEWIEDSIIRFGHDDGILEHGVTVRRTAGPFTIDKKKQPIHTTSVCVVLPNDHKNLANRLGDAKRRADEIVAIDAGASAISKQIALIFGAQVHSFEDFPDQQDPWELASQMAKGDTIERLDLEG